MSNACASGGTWWNEYGRDPAVRLPNTTILLYPMKMISKRIQRGETVDVFDLYNGTAAQVEALKDAAK